MDYKQRVRNAVHDRADRQMNDCTRMAVVDWARYAEIFAYDDQAEMFSLEDPEG